MYLTVLKKIKTILNQNNIEYQVQGMDAWHSNPFMAEDVTRDSMDEELIQVCKLNSQVGCD